MLHSIFAVVSSFVTFILGLISKKNPKIDNKMIPLQNLFIGLFTALIYYLITKDVSLVLAGVGLFTGGTYDIFNNLQKIFDEKKEN